MIDKAVNDDESELIRDLQALGFGEHESRAYMALFKIQPATAYEVSKLAGLPKANGYAVLESLSKKEAVQPVSENPVRYIAAAPSVLFERIATATERRCARVVRNLPKLAQVPEQDYVWPITGAEAIGAKIEQMIDQASSHVWIKAPDRLLEPHRAALDRASRRGVSILIILFGTDIERFSFPGDSRTFLHEGNGIPTGNSPYLVTLTRDFEEALVAEFRGQAHGSHTRNKPVVSIADTLIRHEIYFAEIFEEFGEAIQEAFGPALINMRRKYLPREQVEALETLLLSKVRPGTADANYPSLETLS